MFQSAQLATTPMMPASREDLARFQVIPKHMVHSLRLLYEIDQKERQTNRRKALKGWLLENIFRVQLELFPR